MLFLMVQVTNLLIFFLVAVTLRPRHLPTALAMSFLTGGRSATMHRLVYTTLITLIVSVLMRYHVIALYLLYLSFVELWFNSHFKNLQ